MEIQIDLNDTSSGKDEYHLLDSKSRTHLFKSRKHEVVFYFEINQPFFDSELGIKRVHTKDVMKARELRRAYLNFFHPEKNKDTEFDYKQISKDINALFRRVTGGKL